VGAYHGHSIATAKRTPHGTRMTPDFDFIAACRPGTVLRTRDRSEATITRVTPADGLIHGEVRMFGPCVWRRDGRYRDAPEGAGGPGRSAGCAAAGPGRRRAAQGGLGAGGARSVEPAVLLRLRRRAVGQAGGRRSRGR